jgi:hypothetical protein
MPTNIGAYAKSIVSILAAALAILATALTDGVVTSAEYVNIGIATITAVGVFLMPNLPDRHRGYTKALVAFGGAALAALLTALGANYGFLDVNPSDWITVLLAGLGAIGITILPNSPEPEVAVLEAYSAPAATTINVVTADDAALKDAVDGYVARHAASSPVDA